MYEYNYDDDDDDDRRPRNKQRIKTRKGWKCRGSYQPRKRTLVSCGVCASSWRSFISVPGMLALLIISGLC